MSPSQLLIIFKARWRIMLAVFLGVVLTVLAGVLLMPKKYTASASVLVDVKSPDPIAGMVFPAMMAPGYMATQMDLIQSERVARGAVRALRLTENNAMREQWQETTKGVGSFEAWLAGLLQAGLDVRPSRESSVISLSYEAVDPNFAAAIANAFVQSYINTTVPCSKHSPNSPATAWRPPRTACLPTRRKRASLPPTSAWTSRTPASMSCHRSWWPSRP
jgi:polysaccharide biosynthesis transport protein